MPPQDRVRRDDARDLTQDLPTQPMPTDRQPASIVIGELEPLSTQLASKDPIFFHQIRDRLALLAIQPASQDGEHHLESGRVDHGRSLYHGPQVLPMSVDPVMGHGVNKRLIVPRLLSREFTGTNRQFVAPLMCTDSSVCSADCQTYRE